MYFAWDSRLERVTNEAVRQYYRDRYSLDERDLTSVRAIVGVLRAASLQNVGARTILIERVSPVDTATEGYLRDTIFRDTWASVCGPISRTATTPNSDICAIRNIRNLRCDARISFLAEFYAGDGRGLASCKPPNGRKSCLR